MSYDELYYRNGYEKIVPITPSTQFELEYSTLNSYYKARNPVSLTVFSIGYINDFVNGFYTHTGSDRFEYINAESFYLFKMIYSIYDLNFKSLGLQVHYPVVFNDFIYNFDIGELAMAYYCDIIEGSRLGFRPNGMLTVMRDGSHLDLMQDCFTYFTRIQLVAFFFNEHIGEYTRSGFTIPPEFNAIFTEMRQTQNAEATLNRSKRNCNICGTIQQFTERFRPECETYGGGGSKRKVKSNKRSNKRSKMNRKTRKNRFSLLGKRTPSARMSKTKTKTQSAKPTQRKNRTLHTKQRKLK